MSFFPAKDPVPGDAQSCSAVAHVVVPRSVDLGAFQVHRALPSAQSRMVGPFIFFDHFGPAIFSAGNGIDVRPHPQIGLATVTYLFDGEILHRDSLGNVQPIRPGAVNWMTAGRGIVHSERTPPELRGGESSLFGIQTWVALPKGREEMAPGFTHHGADALPVIEDKGKRLRLIAGSLYGERAPVEVFSEMFYADAMLSGTARLDLPAEHEERAAWVAKGRIEVGGDLFDAGQMLVFRPGEAVAIKALDPSRLILFGGEAMDGQRHVWWNFVSSSAERIEQAAANWKAGRFGKVPGDETEFIPLPEESPGRSIIRS
jgi:redox-sensitive bicupin YhaK (pirin superfamily)